MRQVLSPNEIKRKLPSTKNVLGTCSVFPLHSCKAIISSLSMGGIWVGIVNEELSDFNFYYNKTTYQTHL